MICGLPGLLIDFDGTSYLDPEHAELTFKYLACLDVTCLYLLMEDFELPPNTKPVLEASAQKVGITLKWLPIVDFGKPDQASESIWVSEHDEREKILESDKNIGLACLYGAGRSGMMAAAMAAQHGTGPKKAVRYVRKFYSEAVGSPVQEQWAASGSYLI